MEDFLAVVLLEDSGISSITRRIPRAHIFQHPDGILTSMLTETTQLTLNSSGEPSVQVNEAA